MSFLDIFGRRIVLHTVRLDYRRSLYCINRSIALIAVEYFHRVDHDTLFAEQVLEGPMGLKDSTLYRSSVMMNL